MARKIAVALAAVVPLLLAGCVVSHHGGADGKKDDVSISTPLGGLDVKHNATAASIGLPVYPGATPVKEGDDQAANVHLGFGQWQLRVAALKYRTSDPESKVEAFYRGPLAQYGTVLTCRDGQPVGSPSVTSEGLSCSDEGSHGQIQGVHFSEDHDLSLRTGSKHRQHIVAMKSTDGGTELTLVSLELPHGLETRKDAQ